LFNIRSTKNSIIVFDKGGDIDTSEKGADKPPGKQIQQNKDTDTKFLNQLCRYYLHDPVWKKFVLGLRLG